MNPVTKFVPFQPDAPCIAWEVLHPPGRARSLFMKDPFCISESDFDCITMCNHYRNGKLIPVGIRAIAYSERCQEGRDETLPNSAFSSTKKTRVGVGHQTEDGQLVKWIGPYRMPISYTALVKVLAWFEDYMPSTEYRYFGAYVERKTMLRVFGNLAAIAENSAWDGFANECLRRHLKKLGIKSPEGEQTQSRIRTVTLDHDVNAGKKRFEALLLEGFGALARRRERERVQGN
jgi:hypothetical protein